MSEAAAGGRGGEIRLPPALERWITVAQFTTRKRQKIYRRLAALLNNGVPLNTAIARLQVVAAGMGRKGAVEKVVLQNWQERMRGDPTFGAALRGWSPEEERLLIVAGETGGHLANTLESLIDIMNNVKALKAALRSAITYPMVLVTAMFGYMSIVSLVAVPRFADVYAPENWTGYARGMYLISEVALPGLITYLCLIPALFILYQISVRTIGGRLRIWLDRYPPFSFYRLQTGSGFLLGFGSLLQAGVQATEAMFLLAQRATTNYMRVRIGSALAGLRSGLNVGRAMESTRYEFPDAEILADLVTYSDLKNFEDRLLDISKEWVKDTVVEVTARTKAMNQVLLMMLIIVVGLMVFGLFEIQQQVAAGIRAGTAG
ncbi:MAG: type II secretion system F family protein [Alphaproteobacteria bacterium]|nr:type II secretion system F family protein [Alphaproteobacteria bacterium]MDA7982798.1 type II secretion system F family protein [Alphaproteobacteria bacterium]MDA7987094.1 type II secretion system F family protein [Alphaproteobacteria bacterium]MDA7988324.1 type II secretion system F family protein [Alphaproteobacteria bacterium]MDA8008730.1 type II secretion system F family protein [Alphaproteobacteria bacterium]